MAAIASALRRKRGETRLGALLFDEPEAPAITSARLAFRRQFAEEQHIRKDRMLARAGVEVSHILNSELLEFGTKVIKKLLPIEIVEYWKKDEKLPLCNPICVIPF